MVLEVRNLVRRYSSEVQIGPVSFALAPGEFFTLLGPSGCGKTTTLRCVAGFEQHDSGEILLDGASIGDKRPHRRNVGLVFQSFALFPHLTVAENIAFGLNLRRVDKTEIKRRIDGMLTLVGLPGYDSRYPAQLSGGQQQRVAVARTLVLEPPLLLLDEPLSSLDLKLRTQMRQDLRDLQRRLRKTTVYVTHDQTEALAMSDRIAVFSRGHIEQIGTPTEIYERPATAFVAGFIGSANLIDARVVASGAEGSVLETTTGFRLHALQPGTVGEQVTMMVRPERVRLAADNENAPPHNRFRAELSEMTYLGEDLQLRVLADGKQPLLLAMKSQGKAPDAVATMTIDPKDVVLLPRQAA